MRLGGIQHRLWLWWWELPGGHWWFPYRILGHEMEWSVNGGGPVAWPGKIRCLFRPHSCDGYDSCCYCGTWGWCREHPHEHRHMSTANCDDRQTED